MDTETLADRLRRLREHAELNGRELSALAGLKSKTHVGLIESGERPTPSADTLVALARVLDTTVEWLVTGEGDEPTRDAVRAAVARARTEGTTTTDGAR